MRNTLLITAAIIGLSVIGMNAGAQNMGVGAGGGANVGATGGANVGTGMGGANVGTSGSANVGASGSANVNTGVGTTSRSRHANVHARAQARGPAMTPPGWRHGRKVGWHCRVGSVGCKPPGLRR